MTKLFLVLRQMGRFRFSICSGNEEFNQIGITIGRKPIKISDDAPPPPKKKEFKLEVQNTSLVIKQ